MDLINHPKLIGSIIASTDSKASTTVNLKYMGSASPLAPCMRGEVSTSPPK